MREKIAEIIKKYIEQLEKNNFSFKNIYLFGSYACGKAKKWSDIDIAVISNKFKINRDKNEDLLWHLRRGIDSRIEPHIFTVKDFQDECDPMVYEIKKTGIKIA
ncbi:nucleotidyltransferase domain-containing protein [Patescibacteria group bacterium]|nr:nucleotidyltransferase domain-containing protein [Patescibacteria group bacterium]MBU1421450.1 nucleotidyltransferase domain-containing protein [Patescibacteria group bacterium]